jgi:hypothetical protein
MSGSIVEFAARMASGDWSGVSALGFTHGHLLDGQHRLGAAALAGVPLAVTIDVLDDAVVEGVV